MDKQDLQDDRRSDLPFGEITEKIIGCAFAPEHQAQIITHLKATGIEVSRLSIFAIRNSNTNDTHDTSESISDLTKSCTSCLSMFLCFVRKRMRP